MILTDQSDWVQLFEALKAETRKSIEKHVNIYVSAADADSVCALKILENLFQNEMIPHGWLPVSRYQEIIDDFSATYDENDQVTRYLILINCGASEDIGSLLQLVTRPNVCVIIFDSHRPIMHLAHDEDPQSQLFVIVDAEAESLSLQDIPHAYDDEYDDEGEEGRNASYAENLNANDPNAGRVGKRKVSAEDFRMAYYSSGVHYGKPTACVMYDLSFHLRQETSYFLWLAILGLTDHLVHNKMPVSQYETYYIQYENYVASSGHLDKPGEVNMVDNNADDGTVFQTVSKPTCRIAREEDYRFGLLREWSLWESMLNSPYVAARLQTYSEKGRERLEFLLAKIGIPLREANSSFQFDMKPHYQKRLQEQLAVHGASYNLADCMFQSFQLQDGYNRCVMAMDVVHAATALLECGTQQNPGDAMPQQAVPSPHIARFWKCWSALSWNDSRELKKGIDLAKKVQSSLVFDGGAIVAQRLYHNFRNFRVFDISEHQLTNQSLLVHPMALQRMASFLQEQHYHQSQTNKRKPVVLIAPKNPVTGRCLVVGFQVCSPGQGNRLGAAFAAAAEEVGAQAWHDLFDTSIMEIMVDDVERFKAELLRVASDML